MKQWLNEARMQRKDLKSPMWDLSYSSGTLNSS